MGFFGRNKQTDNVGTARSSSENTTVAAPFESNDHEKIAGDGLDDSKVPRITLRTFITTVIASMGGIVFGYDTGQISGFLEMDVFRERFGQYDPSNPNANSQGYYFSNVRSGLIVGLLSIGTLIGALIAGPVSNKFGRRTTMPGWCLVFCIGVVVQMAMPSGNWIGIMMGRWTAGLGVGALSVLTPLYVSESTPKQIRGAAVCSYQLAITLGILIADCINYGTEDLTNTGSYRIPMGIGFLWPIVLALGMIMLPESPRWDIRNGNHERAFKTMTKFYGVSANHSVVRNETKEINAALEAASGDHPWYEAITGPRMFYRVALAMAMQMWQQLTGANYFFYYGTTIFTGVGIQNPYTTACILGAVNVACTFPGLYFVEKFGRRRCLITGALWQTMCFLIFASVGQFQFLPASTTDAAGNQLDPSTAKTAGTVMIVFACLFIASFASTWGPMVWAVVGEMFPYRYRAVSMGMATSSNWLWNFLLAFFTPFITGDIQYELGYVFAGCNLAAAATVYFFLVESAGRSIEEVDYMYLLEVSPIKSTKWDASQAGENVNSDNLYLASGGRSIKKRDEGRQEGFMQQEDVNAPAGESSVMTGTHHA